MPFYLGSGGGLWIFHLIGKPTVTIWKWVYEIRSLPILFSGKRRLVGNCFVKGIYFGGARGETLFQTINHARRWVSPFQKISSLI